MTDEDWKIIKDTNGLYEVSNKGRVKRNGGRILKNTLMKVGYFSVALSIDGKVKRHYVHKLVAEAFLDHYKEDSVVNHKDGSKTNNAISNLEFISRSENARHWASDNRSQSAGRKRSGFCGRGHKLDDGKTYCNLCRKLISDQEVFPSNDSNWKSLSEFDYMVSDTGLVWSNKTKRVLSPGVNGSGYKYVILRKDSKSISKSVHRLVYEAFVEPIKDGFVIDHINSTKTDNRISNLRQISASQNILSSRTKKRRDSTHGIKYSERFISEIKWILGCDGVRNVDLVKYYGVSQTLISDIYSGKKWSHIAARNPQEIPDEIISKAKSRVEYLSNLRQIKWLISNGSYKNIELAKMFSVSEDVVSGIRVGRLWENLDEEKPIWA